MATMLISHFRFSLFLNYIPQKCTVRSELVRCCIPDLTRQIELPTAAHVYACNSRWRFTRNDHESLARLLRCQCCCLHLVTENPNMDIVSPSPPSGSYKDRRPITALHDASRRFTMVVVSMHMLADLRQGTKSGRYGREPHDALGGPLGRHVRDHTSMDGQRIERFGKCLSTV
jgi:hypothetical protein